MPFSLQKILEELRKIGNLPPGGKRFIVFLLVFIALISALRWVSALDYIKKFLPASIPFSDAWHSEAPEEKTYFGYFHTLNDKKQTVCVKETISLKFYGDNRIEGESKAPVHTSTGTTENSVWQYMGFRHGDDISLSYITNRNPPRGTGVYYLLPAGKDFIGYWLGRDFPDGHRVQCAYVLTESEMKTGKTCAENWPNAFKKKECKIIRREGESKGTEKIRTPINNGRIIDLLPKLLVP